MEKYTRIIRDYPNISFRSTKGEIDIFLDRQFHQYYEIYFLLHGDIEFVNDHVRRKITHNHIVIIPPNEYHRFIVPEEYASDYERCVLNIYPAFLGGQVLADALHGKELLVLPSGHRIISNFLYLKSAMSQNTTEDFQYVLSAVATDIVFLIKQYQETSLHTVHNSLHPVSFKIMDYINKHYKSDLSIPDIAEHFYLSSSTVSHVFKDNFGVSIKKYILEKRMNEIQICLQNGQKPQEVASLFGFANYSTFYRNYCKYFGKAPSKS